MARPTVQQLSDRLKEALASWSNEEVARELAKIDFNVSAETVRRYREGIVQRIDALFIAAVSEAFGIDAAWLLTGRHGNARFATIGR